MIQLTTQPLPGLAPATRAAGFPLGTTSDFALALAELAGTPPGVAAPTDAAVAPTFSIAPTLLHRQDVAEGGTTLPDDAGLVTAFVSVMFDRLPQEPATPTNPMPQPKPHAFGGLITLKDTAVGDAADPVEPTTDENAWSTLNTPELDLTSPVAPQMTFDQNLAVVPTATPVPSTVVMPQVAVSRAVGRASAVPPSVVPPAPVLATSPRIASSPAPSAKARPAALGIDARPTSVTETAASASRATTPGPVARAIPPSATMSPPRGFVGIAKPMPAPAQGRPLVRPDMVPTASATLSTPVSTTVPSPPDAVAASTASFAPAATATVATQTLPSAAPLTPVSSALPAMQPLHPAAPTEAVPVAGVDLTPGVARRLDQVFSPNTPAVAPVPTIVDPAVLTVAHSLEGAFPPNATAVAPAPMTVDTAPVIAAAATPASVVTPFVQAPAAFDARIAPPASTPETVQTNIAPVPALAAAVTPSAPVAGLTTPTSIAASAPALSDVTTTPRAIKPADPVPVTVTVVPLPVTPLPTSQLQPAAQAFAAAMFAAAAPVDLAERASDEGQPLILASGTTPVAAQSPLLAVAAPTPGQQPALDLAKDDWMATMIDRIETLRDESGGVRETRMKLLPEALGSVEVSVRRDETGAIQVRIAADTAQARALLAEAAPKLADMAEARGVKLGGSSVDAGASDQRRDAPSPTPATRRPASAGGDTTIDAATDTRLA